MDLVRDTSLSAGFKEKFKGMKVRTAASESHSVDVKRKPQPRVQYRTTQISSRILGVVLSVATLALSILLYISPASKPEGFLLAIISVSFMISCSEAP